jgi:hypothetical protein
LQEAYAQCRDGGGVKTDLGQKTVADLKRMIYQAYAMKKSKLVDFVLQNLLAQYTRPSGESISYWYNESYIGAIDKLVAKVTDEHIANYAAVVAAERAAKDKALTDPETLEEFTLFFRVKTISQLSDEKLALYDCLVFEKEKAEAHAAVSREVEAIDLGGSGLMKIKEGWHSKRQCPIWIVGLTERLEKETYAPLARKARLLGARWSTWGPKEDHGFVFWKEADAQAFMDLAAGENANLEERMARREKDKQERAADRLSQYADRHLDAAQAELNRDRLENTWRRAQMASSAEARANSDKAFAVTVANVATALESGQLEALSKLRFATQLAELIIILHRANADAVQEEKGRWVPSDERRPVALSDVRFANFSWPYLNVDDAIAAALQLKGKRGATTARKVLENYAARTQDDGRHWFRINSLGNALAVMEMLHKTGSRQERLKESFAGFKRLIRTGIGSPPMLRHALRELVPLLAETDRENELTKKIRALAGRKIDGYFPTPQPVLELLRSHLPDPVEIQANDRPYRILEPSAGTGNIADWLDIFYPWVELQCIERSYELAEIARLKGHHVEVRDFLEAELEPKFDLVVMNPPFEKEADIEHVLHAVTLTKPGGRVMAIMNEHTFFSTTQKAKEFRAYLEALGAYDEKLPDGSFKESGTGVGTRFVVIDIR